MMYVVFWWGLADLSRLDGGRGCSVRGRSRTGSGLLVERVGVLGQLAGGGAREAAETETRTARGTREGETGSVMTGQLSFGERKRN